MTYTKRFRLLYSSITIRTEDETIASGLDFITHDAEQDFPILSETAFDILNESNRYQILKDGELSHTPPDYPNLIYDLLGLIHARALEGLTACIRIHAGCGECNGRRFLVIGDKGAGKSTLMMRLLFEGFRIGGDELILVQNAKVTPFPRRFHVKDGSIDLLPEFKSIIDSVPYIRLYNGTHIYSFSPGDAGYTWRIDTSGVHTMFFLEPNHSGETRAEECPKYLMVEKVMARSFLSESHDHLKIGELCRIIDSADCYILYVGDLKGAVSSIREKMGTHPLLR